MIVIHWNNLRSLTIVSVILFFGALNATDLLAALAALKSAYPNHIQEVCIDGILWTDNTYMPLGHQDRSQTYTQRLNNPVLADQLEQPLYVKGKPEKDPIDDPGRIRYEPFFRKMYGNSPDEVKAHLEQVVWMPRIFGQGTHILLVTRVHNVHEKIRAISHELEELALTQPQYTPFLDHPGGTFCWRTIAGSNRLSNHSFGMTIDINSTLSNYWQWDLQKESKEVSEETELSYRNSVPWDIVHIFEKYGFIWGGKWYHYDTMHFEYRPELMLTDKTTLIFALGHRFNTILLNRIFSSWKRTQSALY